MAIRIFDVIKWEGSSDTLVWKYPGEDFNTRSTLIVDESQAAILYKNGQAADVFTAGRYVMNTQNIPLLRKLIEFPSGGVSSFNCKVYFVNLVEAMRLKWGLNSRVSYIEPVYQIPVSIGARGEMSIKVGDPRYFIANLVGTENSLTAETLTSYFRSLIVMRVKSYLTRTILDQQMNIFTIDTELDALAAALKEKLAPDLKGYGVDLKLFTVDEILKPEDDPLFIRVKRSLSERSTGLFEAETKKQQARIAALSQADTEVIGAQGHRAALDALGTTYQQERQFDISQTVAGNPGMSQFTGFAGSMAMMGGAIAMGNQVASVVNQTCGTAAMPQAGAAQPQADAYQPQAGAYQPQAGIAQPQTGASQPQAANAASVPSAGKTEPASAKKKVCCNCGQELPFSARFCFECGAQQPRLCPVCGKEVPDSAKFCLECGTRL